MNTVLTYLGDRMEMAHSVEGRVPFLDHHVAEYVAGLPIRHKIRGTREKYVLREAVRGVITPEVYNRPRHIHGRARCEATPAAAASSSDLCLVQRLPDPWAL